MEISTVYNNGKARFRYLLIAGYALLSLLAIGLLGVKGLILSIGGLLGIIVTPFIYNKPTFILFSALFLYPLTRLLSTDDKVLVTGGLYLLALPSTIWLIGKYFKKVAEFSPYLWTLAAYSILILLNIFRPDQIIMDVIKEFGRSYFAIFTILSIYNYAQINSANLDKISKYLSYIFNFIALTGVLQLITKKGGIVMEGVYRIRGTFFNFNDYGFAVSLFIAFALFMYLFKVKAQEKTYWIFTIGFNMVALLATFSKTSYINAGLAFLFMSLFLSWKTRLQILAGLSVLGTAIMGFLIATGSLSLIVQRFSDNSSLNWRFNIWRNLYNMILHGNIFLGQGVESARNYLKVVMPLGESYAPHNVYLETWYNLGLIGLFLLILTLLLIVIKGILILFEKNNENSPHIRIIATATCLIAVITLVQNSASNAFYDRSGNIFFWAIIAILGCWYNRGCVTEQSEQIEG
ncbi:MAG: O-antigen ligase family protein [bacterium]